MKKSIILLGFCFAMMLGVTHAQTTQSSTASPTTYCTTCWDDAPPPAPQGDAGVPVPIDGGLSVLLIAGAAYGAKRIRDSRKHSSTKLD